MSQTFSPRSIAFQGAPGAYSHQACGAVYPDAEAIPCLSFEDAFAAVQDKQADLAMIAIDNSLAGRVADVHRLLPGSGLHIIGEYFLPVHHALLAVRGTRIDQVCKVYSHIHALPQCRKIIRRLGIAPMVHADTAGAAKDVAARNDPSEAAIASTLAARIYGLDILMENIEDEDYNTTRFLILSGEGRPAPFEKGGSYITTMVFQVRDIPAALYKALGGFATNGINLTKLESYVDRNFQAGLFYCDVEGHPDDPLFALALEELRFFAQGITLMGTYPAHPFRRGLRAAKEGAGT